MATKTHQTVGFVNFGANNLIDKGSIPVIYSGDFREEFLKPQSQ